MAKKVIDQLVTELTADGAKMRSGLNKNIKETQAWGKKIGNIVAASVGIIGGAQYIKKVVDATRVQEAALAQLQQTLISTNGAVGLSFDQLVTKAADLQRVTTFGDEEIIKAQSQLATFTNITGDSFNRATEAALDLSAKMDQDLKSSIVQIGKALNDPVAGLSSLSRVGIQFTEDQKDLIKSLNDSGRTAEAQTVILEELERQFGGSAVAARKTFGGALEALKNAAGDLMEADGLGGATDGIEELTKLLSDPKTVEAAQLLSGGIIKAFTFVTGAISDAVGMVRFLSEEMAAFFNGPAIGDTVRISEAIADVTSEIDKAQKRSRVGRGNNDFVIAKIEDLEAEKRRLQDLLALSNELSETKVATVKVDRVQGAVVSPVAVDPPVSKKKSDEAAKLKAENDKLIEINRDYFEQLKMDRLQADNNIVDIEKARYARDQKQLEEGLAQLREKGLLTAEIEAESRQAQLDAEAVHAQKVAEIRERAAAENEALVNSNKDIYQAIYEERLKAEGKDAELENIRYERQKEALSRELDLMRERGALTQEIENEYRMAQENAAQNHQDRLTDIQDTADAARRETMELGYTSLLDAVGSFYEGMEGKDAGYARAAISIGKTLLDEKKRNSVKSILASTQTAAMGAYESLASIQYVGPFLGAAAATGIYIVGGAAAAKVAGIAHDGIDSIPTTGTWVLEKGERVTTQKTSAKLDKTLTDIQGVMHDGSSRGGMRSSTQNIYVTGTIDNRTATQMQRESERAQRMTSARLSA